MERKGSLACLVDTSYSYSSPSRKTIQGAGETRKRITSLFPRVQIPPGVKVRGAM